MTKAVQTLFRELWMKSNSRIKNFLLFTLREMGQWEVIIVYLAQTTKEMRG